MAEVAASRRWSLEYWGRHHPQLLLAPGQPRSTCLWPRSCSRQDPPAGHLGGHTDGDGLLVVAFGDGAGDAPGS
jgi:hypothetical protein